MKLNELKTEVYKQINVTTTKEVKALYPDRNLRLTESWEAILEELTSEFGSNELNEEPQDDIENFPTDWAGIATTIEKYDRFNEQACLECSRTNGFGECEIQGDVVSPADRCDEFVPIDIAEAILSNEGQPDSTFITFGMPSVDPEWVEDETPFAPVPVALWDFMPGANLVDIFSVTIPSDWVYWVQAICTFLGVHSRTAALMHGRKQTRQASLEV